MCCLKLHVVISPFIEKSQRTKGFLKNESVTKIKQTLYLRLDHWGTSDTHSSKLVRALGTAPHSGWGPCWGGGRAEHAPLHWNAIPFPVRGGGLTRNDSSYTTNNSIFPGDYFQDFNLEEAMESDWSEYFHRLSLFSFVWFLKHLRSS